ncbi:hypothetical protein BX616_009834 [Lobosporangium transversale]|uniref:Uncharacterized protein n=1 Tax=Lobosporangium transversale TaxID=64571 RepID=A0A1Y2H085_9FUNG|nr:hypothetical protein BCR41DRAFT_392784 [Lobosporangium transversale]KAF9913607.1 hypothetical protein BX616_009834 [Lobosporangium transversale]ORZ27454.1 hypothetical protein BCR41DRAFT_392784 [Lobosporangium transversale]|eukprot:XP_021885181.1 hypothetical protein BCR41DRAFT_392784 [Lobosporangium transversale]
MRFGLSRKAFRNEQRDRNRSGGYLYHENRLSKISSEKLLYDNLMTTTSTPISSQTQKAVEGSWSPTPNRRVLPKALINLGERLCRTYQPPINRHVKEKSQGYDQHYVFTTMLKRMRRKDCDALEEPRGQRSHQDLGQRNPFPQVMTNVPPIYDERLYPPYVTSNIVALKRQGKVNWSVELPQGTVKPKSLASSLSSVTQYEMELESNLSTIIDDHSTGIPPAFGGGSGSDEYMLRRHEYGVEGYDEAFVISLDGAFERIGQANPDDYIDEDAKQSALPASLAFKSPVLDSVPLDSGCKDGQQSSIKKYSGALTMTRINGSQPDYDDVGHGDKDDTSLDDIIKPLEGNATPMPILDRFSKIQPYISLLYSLSEVPARSHKFYWTPSGSDIAIDGMDLGSFDDAKSPLSRGSGSLTAEAEGLYNFVSRRWQHQNCSSMSSSSISFLPRPSSLSPSDSPLLPLLRTVKPFKTLADRDDDFKIYQRAVPQEHTKIPTLASFAVDLITFAAVYRIVKDPRIRIVDRWSTN